MLSIQGVVLQALQNNLAKIYNARNNIYAENVKLELCTCVQSMALDTRAKFQLEILIRRMISWRWEGPIAILSLEGKSPHQETQVFFYYCNNIWSFHVGIYMFKIPDIKAEIILVMGSASERRRYNAKSSLIGSAHAQNDPWKDFKMYFWSGMIEPSPFWGYCCWEC